MKPGVEGCASFECSSGQQRGVKELCHWFKEWGREQSVDEIAVDKGRGVRVNSMVNKHVCTLNLPLSK
jgi:hypothetical protein